MCKSMVPVLIWCLLISAVRCLPSSIQTTSNLSAPFWPPGDTPFRYCNESSKTDILSIEHVELWPQPLYIDDVFAINMYGTYSKDVPPNSTLTFRVQIGDHTPDYNPGWSTVVDFCYVVEQVDQPDPHHQHHCPPKKGWAFMQQVAWTHPMFFNPPGPYTMKFDAKTPDGERIYCAEASLYLDFPEGDPRKWSSHRADMKQKIMGHSL